MTVQYYYRRCEVGSATALATNHQSLSGEFKLPVYSKVHPATLWHMTRTGWHLLGSLKVFRSTQLDNNNISENRIQFVLETLQTWGARSSLCVTERSNLRDIDCEALRTAVNSTLKWRMPSNISLKCNLTYRGIWSQRGRHDANETNEGWTLSFAPHSFKEKSVVRRLVCANRILFRQGGHVS